MASVPNGDLVEYCLRPSPLMRKLVKNLPPVVRGRVPVPSEAELGIEAEQDSIREFRVAQTQHSRSLTRVTKELTQAR